MDLIGAGPGNPELMTLAAVRALGEASVVLVDELVDERCLEFTRGRVIHVGKRGGCLSTPQRFIERLMIRLARGGASSRARSISRAKSSSITSRRRGLLPPRDLRS